MLDGEEDIERRNKRQSNEEVWEYETRSNKENRNITIRSGNKEQKGTITRTKQ